VVNEAFAAKFFRGVDPTGREVQMRFSGSRKQTIVGVAADLKRTHEIGVRVARRASGAGQRVSESPCSVVGSWVPQANVPRPPRAVIPRS
jgi:hypothetical protein